MAEDQKKAENPFEKCCQGMPITEMMRKMVEKKMTGSPFDCAEMMSRIGRMCGGAAKKEQPATEGPTDKEKI